MTNVTTVRWEPKGGSTTDPTTADPSTAATPPWKTSRGVAGETELAHQG